MLIRFPATREYAKEFADRAEKNGCKPFWWEHYEAYCCGCNDRLHAADQQCSVINDKSSQRVRHDGP